MQNLRHSHKNLVFSYSETDCIQAPPRTQPGMCISKEVWDAFLLKYCFLFGSKELWNLDNLSQNSTSEGKYVVAKRWHELGKLASSLRKEWKRWKKKKLQIQLSTIQLMKEHLSQSSYWELANHRNTIQDLMSRKDWPRNNKGSKASQGGQYSGYSPSKCGGHL